MTKRGCIIVCVLAASLVLPGKTLAQASPPDALAAAKELIVEAKLGDQMRLALPMILQQLKPLVARGNPVVERDFDTLIPVVMAAANTHLDSFLDSGAALYAKHFTAEEMKQVTNFYRTQAGRKFLQKQPEIMRESMTLGQQFGQLIAQDIQSRMVEELRKRGHNI